MSDDPITIRPYRSGDEVGILDCYNRIFPTPDGAIPERSMAHWRWKFPGNPTGLLQHVVADQRQAGIVGAYSGIPVAIRYEGRRQLAAQLVDLMVLPEWRRHGARPGLFVQLGRKYEALYYGREDGKVRFTYGWPVPAWRMGQRYLGYRNIRDWDLVFRETGGSEHRPRSAPADLETRPVERFGADVDRLFAALEPDLGLALVRDAGYLNWRYADRPDHDYALYECRERSGGALRGVCVYTVGSLLRPNTGFMVDWLAPADDEAATVSMLACLEARSVRDRTGMLAAVWSQVDPRFLVFQRLGYMVRGTGYFLVMAGFKHDTRYYRDHWYYTMGDSDLI